MSGYLLLVARAWLALVLVTSLATKAGGWAPFVDWVRQLRVVGHRWAPLLAAGLAAVEVVTLGLLLVPATAAAGLLLTAATIGGFGVAIGWLRRRGVVVGCRCLGADTGRPMGTLELVRNGVLSAVAAVAAAVVLAADRSGLPAVPLATAAAAWLLGAGLAAVTARLAELVALVRPASAAAAGSRGVSR